MFILHMFFLSSQQSVPPVMAFHLGSLGFLTPFEFDNFEEQVTNVLEGEFLFFACLRNIIKPSSFRFQ